MVHSPFERFTQHGEGDTVTVPSRHRNVHHARSTSHQSCIGRDTDLDYFLKKRLATIAAAVSEPLPCFSLCKSHFSLAPFLASRHTGFSGVVPFSRLFRLRHFRHSTSDSGPCRGSACGRRVPVLQINESHRGARYRCMRVRGASKQFFNGLWA